MPDAPVFDDDDIVDHVGEVTAERGLHYLEDGRVISVDWNPSARTLQGVVDGTAARPYSVTIIVPPLWNTGSRLLPVVSKCTCPMRTACKHVAAVLYTRDGGADDDDDYGNDEFDYSPQVPPLWSTLLAPAARPDPTPLRAGGTREIGLQLRVTLPQAGTRYSPAQPHPQLEARVAVLGTKGRWTQGAMIWARLTNAPDTGTAEQRRALSAIDALHAGDVPFNRRDAWLNLGRINSPLLWDALNQIVDLGIPIILNDPSCTPVRVLDGEVDACLDIAQRDGDLLVSVPLHVDGAALEPRQLGFLGRPAHGMFTWDLEERNGRLEPTHLRLAKLATPLSDAITTLAEQPPVRVPEADIPAFTQGLLPGLLAHRAVFSSDGSFAMPEPARPILEARLTHFGQARLEITWAWRYAVPGADPGTAPRCALYPGHGDDFAIHRDLAAEQVILASVAWVFEEYPHLGAPTAVGHRLASIGMLVGLPMLAFVGKALPRLQGDDSIMVVIEGSPMDYREAHEAPVIEVSATSRENSRDWLDLSIIVRVDDQDVPFEDLLRALAAGDDILILPSGTYLMLDRPELHRLRDLIDEARSLQESTRGPLGINRYHVDLWSELEKLGIVDEQAHSWRQSLLALAEGGLGSERAIPASLHATLRDYQAEGYAWLAHLRENGLGGVLADDMGLGKTLQAIALIADERGPAPKTGGKARGKAKAAGARPPWLVVAPASVVHNWALEVAKFAPSLKVVAIGETSAKRGRSLADEAAGADVVVVSYTLFRLDFDEFNGLEWAGLFLDEAQFVKNHQSKAYACARQLKAPVKFAITGTPMENNLMELWSILSITAPGLFPNPKRFAEFFQKPIEREADDERLLLLRRRIRPFLLRRTKEHVAADLPPKQEQVLELDLHPRHRRIYDTRLQRERQKVLGLLGDLDANRFQIFQTLTMLRQLSLDAGLVDDTHAGIPSAKLDALMEMLDDVISEGHRVLVFSQFTRYLALARARLDAAGISYSYLDGSTRNRAKAIDAFREGTAPVFLISLKAGGFGLNLTEADYVVLLDPWWNPATEAQAVDRAHRIGQDRQVMVYRLVSRDTIEEKVMALKAEKAALFAGVMSDAGAGGIGLTAEDIRELLG